MRISAGGDRHSLAKSIGTGIQHTYHGTEDVTVPYWLGATSSMNMEDGVQGTNDVFRGVTRYLPSELICLYSVRMRTYNGLSLGDCRRLGCVL